MQRVGGWATRDRDVPVAAGVHFFNVAHRAHPDDCVVSESGHRVEVRSAVHCIETLAASGERDQVVACTTVDGVVTAVASQGVVACVTGERVVAGIAGGHVVAGGADPDVVASSTHEGDADDRCGRAGNDFRAHDVIGERDGNSDSAADLVCRHRECWVDGIGDVGEWTNRSSRWTLLPLERVDGVDETVSVIDRPGGCSYHGVNCW